MSRASAGKPVLAGRIEAMQPADLDDVWALARACFTVPWERQSFAEELERPWAWCRVARVAPGAPICGFSSFWIIADELQLHNLAIDPASRRRGWGRALLRDVLAAAEHRGVARAHLEVRRSNDAALQLYRAMGFRGIGVRPRYYADNDEDAIVMVCEADVRGRFSGLGHG